MNIADFTPHKALLIVLAATFEKSPVTFQILNNYLVNILQCPAMLSANAGHVGDKLGMTTLTFLLSMLGLQKVMNKLVKLS